MNFGIERWASCFSNGGKIHKAVIAELKKQGETLRISTIVLVMIRVAAYA